MLGYLDSSAADYEARALIVKALKSMQNSLQYGEEVSAVLRANPIWKEFEAQRHDLFIKNESTLGALTQVAPGVAGYLTAQSKPAPMQPPPMEDPGASSSNSNINNNPLL